MTYKVLVVDDEADILESVVGLLTDLGHESDVASGARDAQRLLHEERYDVILSDQRMPGMKGLELLAWAHDEAPAMRCVLMSAAAVEGLGPPLPAHLHAFLYKPFGADQLTKALGSRSSGA